MVMSTDAHVSDAEQNQHIAAGLCKAPLRRCLTGQCGRVKRDSAGDLPLLNTLTLTIYEILRRLPCKRHPASDGK
jgi:hypothetical protein